MYARKFSKCIFKLFQINHIDLSLKYTIWYITAYRKWNIEALLKIRVNTFIKQFKCNDWNYLRHIEKKVWQGSESYKENVLQIVRQNIEKVYEIFFSKKHLKCIKTLQRYLKFIIPQIFSASWIRDYCVPIRGTTTIGQYSARTK